MSLPSRENPAIVAVASALVVALGLAWAGPAQADKLLFSGEHGIRFSINAQIKEVVAAGTGVAIVNGSAGGTALHTLKLTRPFAEIDSTLTSPVGISEVQFHGVRINPDLAGPNGNPGVFSPILTAVQSSLALSQNTLPAAGTVKLCNLIGCPSAVTLTLSQTTNGVAIGAGVGGSITAGGAGATRITLVGAPWTIGTTTVSFRTVNGGTDFFTSMGFAQGSMSGTSTTLPSGTVQLVSGIQANSLGFDGPNDLSGQIVRLTLNFAPEPGLLLLLGAGSLGMLLLGRKRIRR